MPDVTFLFRNGKFEGMANMVIQPLSSRRGSITLIVGLTIASVFLILGGVGLAASQPLVTCLVLLGMALLFGGFAIAMFYIFPRIRLVFKSAAGEVSIRATPGKDSTIAFSALKPFVIHKTIRYLTPMYYCSNNSFKEHSYLFVSPFRRKVMQRAIRLKEITGCKLIDNSE